jgi:hypothetical protein
MLERAGDNMALPSALATLASMEVCAPRAFRHNPSWLRAVPFCRAMSAHPAPCNGGNIACGCCCGLRHSLVPSLSSAPWGCEGAMGVLRIHLGREGVICTDGLCYTLMATVLKLSLRTPVPPNTHPPQPSLSVAQRRAQACLGNNMIALTTYARCPTLTIARIPPLPSCASAFHLTA